MGDVDSIRSTLPEKAHRSKSDSALKDFSSALACRLFSANVFS